jgi:hypothetical protein
MRMYTNTTVILVMLLWLSSCTSPAYKGLAKQCSNANKVFVHFYEAGTKHVVKSKVAKEEEAIGVVRNYLDGGKAPNNNCKPDGMVVFYNNDSIQIKAYIHYKQPNCWQLSTKVNNEWVYIDLSAEGKTFFEALEKDADKNDIILYF